MEAPETRSALIVEDEAIIAIDLAELLALEGCRVHGPVSRGEDAVALARDVPLDLLVVDVNLAGRLDGIETAERVQALRLTPVLVIAARPEGQLAARLRGLLACRYLTKPFEPEALSVAVRSLLGSPR